MSANIVEALSRVTAQSSTRRGSLLTLGSVLAASAVPSLAEAKKSKKGKKKAKRKAAERAENQANLVCQSQVEGCKSQILAVCQAPGGVCFALADCCSSLGTCNTSEFFTCLVTTAG